MKLDVSVVKVPSPDSNKEIYDTINELFINGRDLLNYCLYIYDCELMNIIYNPKK